MQQRPNPLTDELSPDAKAELAAIFREMKRRLDARYEEVDYCREQARRGRPVWLHNFDRPSNRRGW